MCLHFDLPRSNPFTDSFVEAQIRTTLGPLNSQVVLGLNKEAKEVHVLEDERDEQLVKEFILSDREVTTDAYPPEVVTFLNDYKKRNQPLIDYIKKAY